MKNSSHLVKGLFIICFIATGWLAYSYFSSSKPDVYTIGISRWSSSPSFERSIDGFKTGLEESGYIEGKNITYIIKNPEADIETQRQIIQSFIKDDVDLIFTLTTPGTAVAKAETEKMSSPTPVVFSVCTYPVESNLIESLESSGNNLVGTRNYVPINKQYFAFEKLYPHTKTLAVVRRKDEPNSTNQLREITALLEERSIQVLDIAAVDLEDIRHQLEVNAHKIDAVFSTCDTLTHNGGEEIIVDFSQRYKKPTFACNKEGVLKGHLVGNIGDFKAIGQISGEKAALILAGSKPEWLTTESPREDYLVINKKTADLLNIQLPTDLLELAKEVISE